FEQLDDVGTIRPAVPQDLDGHDAAGLRVVGPKDPAEASRGNLVQQPIAAQEEAVGIAFEEFAGLIGRDEALALADAAELLVGGGRPRVGEGVLRFVVRYQPQLDHQLGEGSNHFNIVCHGASKARLPGSEPTRTPTNPATY